MKELKNEQKAREYLEDEEVEKLMKSFDKGLYKEHRDSMIIMLLMDTEMRLGECLKIKLQDIDMTERTICLPAENTKGRQTRFVFFSVTTARSLQRWIRFKDRYSCGAYLFSGKTGMPFEVHSFETNFKRYLARAGIEKEYTPHALRNNFAKRCLMNGMDIYTLSRILGHSSVTVTEKAYLNRIFDLINQEFFQCTLSRPTITIQSTPKAYGHFSLRDDTWISKKGATHEINLGAGTLARPIEEVCATLLHEMVHYHNYVLGIQDCPRGGTYHNRRFRDSAEEHGLIVNHHDKYG